MVIRVFILWLIGLLTLVPYGTYYLFFHATRDQYAILITFVLFWIFGFWGVAAPLISAIKTRQVFKAIEMAKSKEELEKIIQSPEAEDTLIDLIASENHIPKWLARYICRKCIQKLQALPESR